MSERTRGLVGVAEERRKAESAVGMLRKAENFLLDAINKCNQQRTKRLLSQALSLVGKAEGVLR